MVQLLLLAVALEQSLDSRAPASRPTPSEGSARTEVVMMFKTLTAERSLATGSPSPLTIGIVVDPESTASVLSAEVMAREFRSAEELLGRRIRVNIIEVNSDGVLADGVDADVVYVTPVRSRLIEPIVDWTRRHRLISFTGVPAFVERGLVAGVDGSGKIIVNRTACKAVGAEFSSGLLRVAKVID